MQRNSFGSGEIARFGMGTKHLPRTDVTRVERLDTEAAHEILQAALDCGVDCFDTGYSHHKGESESFLGDELAACEQSTFVQTSYFELIDPRFEYVFQKQQKKLRRTCIDLYTVEGVCNLTRMRDIESGAVDFLFEKKEAGEIGMLGFSSELNVENLKDYLNRYPWDYVRLRINFFDWFTKNAREQYETVSEFGLPVVAHAALNMGPKEHLKPEARTILKEANPQYGEVEWGLRFVKSLENVRLVTCNAYSTAQLREDCAVFDNDTTLSSSDFNALEQAAIAQKASVKARA